MDIKRLYIGFKNRINYHRVIRTEMALINSVQPSDKCRVFYLGITPHSNLGDMAQHYCICKWIEENYFDYELLKFEAKTVVDSQAGFIKCLKAAYTGKDIIVFQSGYTTQDLGG